jgi:Ca-activated chloride channel family protein
MAFCGGPSRSALLLLTLVLPASGPQAQGPPLVRKRVNEVRLTLVVTDRNERPLPSLSPRDIRVLDDGLPVSEFDLSPANDLPLRVAILLDVSDSTRESWGLEREAVTESFQRLFRTGDQLLLLAFSNKIELERSINDPVQLDSVLQPPVSGGLTAMFDAVIHACGHSMFQAGTEPQRRALILISDGEDNLSVHGLNDAVERAEATGLFIYTIARHDPKRLRAGDQVLQRLAVSTGGRDFVVKDANQLNAALRAVNRELRSSYLLFYRSPDRPGNRGFRRVEVIPSRGAGLRVRSRAGYFVDP